jgi:hypothetical protein
VSDKPPRDDDERAPDQRRAPRVDVPLLVQFQTSPNGPWRVEYAINVSRSGLFIETDDLPPLGATVPVQVTTRDGPHGVQVLQGEGRVVRHAPGGTGIELVGFDDASRAILDDVVAAARKRRRNRPQ